MARARRFSPLLGLLVFAVFGLASVETKALAQQGAARPESRALPGAAVSGRRRRQRAFRRRPWHRSSSRRPVHSGSIQRDVNDKADIPIVLDDSDKPGSTIVSCHALTRSPAMPRSRFNQAESKLVGVPVGGPYTI